MGLLPQTLPEGPKPGAPSGRRSPAERRESQGAPGEARLCEIPGIIAPRTPFFASHGFKQL